MNQEAAKEKHKVNVERWEEKEKMRKVQYGKLKKDYRISNLKMDCFNERLGLVQAELTLAETDLNAWKDFLQLHKTSFDNFMVMRAKQYIEKDRQKQCVDALQVGR